MNGFSPLPFEGGDPEPISFGISAFAVLHLPQDGFAALRKRPGPDVGKPLSAGLLRQADEQSVAAAAAVFHAIHDFNLQNVSYSDWSVVAAPCLLGRTAAAAVLDKYSRLGPRGVSPLVSPYLSLHAVSALISLALKTHGPNLGVGGGPGSVAEGMLAGLTLMLEPSTPGVWLALTAWDPEPTGADASSDPAVCHAVALALTPTASKETALRLRYVPSAPSASAFPPTVVGLAQFLEDTKVRRPGRWCCPIKSGGEVDLVAAAGSSALRLQRAGERS